MKMFVSNWNFFSSPDLIESMDRSPIHIPLPSKERDDPVWKGFVMMPSIAKFAANAYRISGPCDHLSKLVPDTLHICGRITHEQVWDYLYQLKSTTHKVSCVMPHWVRSVNFPTGLAAFSCMLLLKNFFASLKMDLWCRLVPLRIFKGRKHGPVKGIQWESGTRAQTFKAKRFLWWFMITPLQKNGDPCF